MTREARMISGIILITVPTIQYGGYFLLTSLMNKGSGYMENPLRQNFFRAGHAHAGVIVILSLVCQMHRGCGSSSNTYALVRSNRSATLRDSHFGGVLLLSAARNGYSSQWSGRPDLRRGSDSRCWGCHAWCWVVAVSTTELGLLFQ